MEDMGFINDFERWKGLWQAGVVIKGIPVWDNLDWAQGTVKRLVSDYDENPGVYED